MEDIKTMIENMKSIEDSKYSFKRLPSEEGCDTFQVIDAESGEHVDTWTFDSNDQISSIVGEVSPEAMKDYVSFKTRPEWWLGKKVYPETLDEIAKCYNMLIVACMLARLRNYGDDFGMKHGMRILDWLATTDFYGAPASGRFHDSYEGGLINHTISVYNQMCELWKINKFNKLESHSFALAALTHDWCKIGLYESYMRNVKDEKTGQWNQVKSYRWREDGPTFAFGHGVSSMFLLSRFVNLKADEAAAIRWHMSWCNVADSEQTDLQTSNERYPLVHMLQFADQLSIVRY